MNVLRSSDKSPEPAPLPSDLPLREPPHSLEAEAGLLGAILMNNRAYGYVSDYLRPEHFTDRIHAEVYATAAAVIEQGRAASPVTLASSLPRDLQPPEGMKWGAYLTSLASAAVTVINAGDYGRLIHDLFLRRELINIGSIMVNDAYDGAADLKALQHIERSEERLFALTAHETGGGMVDLDTAAGGAIDIADEAHKRGGKLVGVTTGLSKLDGMLGGLHKSDLLILAGRPSMGKTGLGTAIAFNAARDFARSEDPKIRGKKVAFFSLEMSREQLATRVLSHIAKLDSHSIRSGYLKQQEFELLIDARRELAEVPLKIDDTPAITLSGIRTRCRRLARKGGLGLIVIDYLQLLGSSGFGRPENRVQEISAITRGLKALAKDLDVPVLALSQLSRAVEQRENKRPQLSDLRESGTIEQDSDAVIFVYREQYYIERDEPKQKAEEDSVTFAQRYSKHIARQQEVMNIAELIIAKQRHGPVGTVRAHFNPPTTWFSDLDDHKPSDQPVSHETKKVARNIADGPPPGHPAGEQFPMELL